MTPTIDIASDRVEPTRMERLLWITLIITSGVGLSTFFACATPFAALATLSALKLGRRDMTVVMGLIWSANQAIGYGVLAYPWTGNSAAWGLAIGMSAGLAVLTARGLSTTRPAPLAVSLPFMAAFATFELGLYAAGFVLSGSAGAFTGAVVGHVFLINAIVLCSLIAIYHLVLLACRRVQTSAGTSLTA